jgi:hypothetical protein
MTALEERDKRTPESPWSRLDRLFDESTMIPTPPRPSPHTIPAPREPVDAFPRRTSGRSADGRRWELLAEPGGVTAVTRAGTVAEARVSERDEQVVVELWADAPDLPPELGAHLISEAFLLPAAEPHRPVLVCVPRREGAMLAHARRHVDGARTRAAGVTCLIEGRIGEDPSSTRAADRPRR